MITKVGLMGGLCVGGKVASKNKFIAANPMEFIGSSVDRPAQAVSEMRALPRLQTEALQEACLAKKSR